MSDAEDDNKDSTPLQKTFNEQFNAFFRSLPPTGSDVWIFFRHGKNKGSLYYSAYNSTCDVVAAVYIKTEKCIKLFGSVNPLRGCYVREDTFRDIVVDQHRRVRIQVFAKDEDNPRSDWKMAQQSSPGNVEDFEELLGEAPSRQNTGHSSMIVALSLSSEGGRPKFACAACNGTRREFLLAEFVDSVKLTNLESFLIQLNCSECLLNDSQFKGRALEESAAGTLEANLKGVLDSVGATTTALPNVAFTKGATAADVAALLKGGAPAGDGRAAQALLVPIVNYLHLAKDESQRGQYSIADYNLQEFMRLDACAVASLHLFPPNGGVGEGGDEKSLFQLLNACVTTIGSRLLKQWISQPLLDVAAIGRRLDIVEAMVSDGLMKTAIRSEVLHKIPDLDTIQKKFARGRASLRDVHALGSFVKSIPLLVEIMKKAKCEARLRDVLQSEFLEFLESCAPNLQLLEVLLEQTIELTPQGEVLMVSTFDEELHELSKRRREVEKSLEKLYTQVQAKLDLPPKNLKMEFNPQTGAFYFRVARQNEGLIKGKSWTVVDTKKDGVKFVNGDMMALNDQRRTIMSAFEERQASLAKQLLQTTSSYLVLIEEVKDVLSQIDVFCAFAHVATSARVPYCRPDVRPTEERVLHLVAGRHPMLEAHAKHAVIANDVPIDSPGAPNLWVITGPNMGGKSVYIRMIALVQIMAQVGMMVPCAAACVSVRKSVMARLGAEDMQAKGISTFMKEMLEVSSMLQCASHDSLLIVDELGRGTSTNDGFGIAWAIAEHVAVALRATCFFATHFHELTELSEHCPNVGNLHVGAHLQDDSLVMTYRMEKGPANCSFGVRVAMLAGFPPSITSEAEKIAQELGGEENLSTKRRRVTSGISSRAVPA